MEPIELLLALGTAWFLWNAFNPASLTSVVQSIETGASDIVNSAGNLMGNSYSASVKAIANAIAVAEGFYAPGSIPERANNPGDLMMGDVPAGVPTNGTLGAGLAVFVNLDDGWNALYHKIDRILTGNSSVYDPNWSISQIADKYTATEPAAWASNVSSVLGVSPGTTLADAAALHA